jgi:hypothetical protein
MEIMVTRPFHRVTWRFRKLSVGDLARVRVAVREAWNQRMEGDVPCLLPKKYMWLVVSKNIKLVKTQVFSNTKS